MEKIDRERERKRDREIKMRRNTKRKRERAKDSICMYFLLSFFFSEGFTQKKEG